MARSVSRSVWGGCPPWAPEYDDETMVARATLVSDMGFLCWLRGAAEGQGAQLVDVDLDGGFDLRLGQGAAGQAAVDEVGERLRRGRFVHDGGLDPVHVVAQAGRRGGEPVAVERVGGQETGRQLRRVEV